MPAGLSPDDAAAGVAGGRAPLSLITPEVAAELAAQAKDLAGQPEVAASGGDATASPAFKTQLADLTQKAVSGGR